MADIRESFPTLEDGSGEGAPLRQVQEGDAVAAINGSLAFSFKDATGNAVAAPVKASGDAPGAAVPTLPAKDTAGNLIELPVKVAGDAPGNAMPSMPFMDNSGNLAYGTLDVAGNLKVAATIGATGNGKRARGQASGSSSLVTVATITLATSKIYDGLDFIVSCTRDSMFQVILSDNAVETIISEAIVGSGMPSFHASLKEAEIASGATGTQLLLIKAKNLVAASLSDFHASLSVNEN